jgi:hypothetical protein
VVGIERPSQGKVKPLAGVSRKTTGLFFKPAANAAAHTECIAMPEKFPRRRRGAS